MTDPLVHENLGGVTIHTIKLPPFPELKITYHGIEQQRFYHLYLSHKYTIEFTLDFSKMNSEEYYYDVTGVNYLIKNGTVEIIPTVSCDDKPKSSLITVRQTYYKPIGSGKIKVGSNLRVILGTKIEEFREN